MEKLEEDRLSSLPNVILHYILSKLPEKDATRTSVLSKTWLDTWYTFPMLSFCTSKFMKNKRPRKILGFRGYVKRRILRFHDQSLTIKEFKLKLGCNYISKDVDIWLKLACECGVEVIEYSQDVPVGQDRYRVLPMCVIEAKSITKLVLKGYIKIDPIFMNHSIKFPSLRVLSLESVCVGDEHAMNHLISLCPLIESINLRNLRNLQMNISSLQKLKRVDAFKIQNVSVDSPTVETICYHCPYDFNSPFKIDFDRCRNLKELWMWSVKGAFFTEMWFIKLFRKFPFLESLKLNNCKILKRVYISSVRLKVLELSDCKMTEWIYISSSSVRLKVLKLSNCFNMKEVIINAPNLLSCGYEGVRLKSSAPTISFKKISSQLEVDILIHADKEGLCNLRKFLLQNIKPNNVLTSLYLSLSLDVGVDFKVDAPDLVALQASSTLPRIKHLNINYVSNFFQDVIKFLLLSCCPTTISFRNNLDCKESIEFFYKKMIRIRKVDECFCSSYVTKCWWHGLKDVKVTSTKKMNENVDFKTILKSLTTLTPQESIIFRLEF